MGAERLLDTLRRVRVEADPPALQLSGAADAESAAISASGELGACRTREAERHRSGSHVHHSGSR